MVFASSTTGRWLSTVVVLLTLAEYSEGIRGGALRRRTQVSGWYLFYNGTDTDGGAHEVLHMLDFPSHENILDQGLAVDDEPEEREGSDEEESDEGPHPKSKSKSSKAPKKQGRAEKWKAGKHSKGTPMPSVSSSPSSMPSISNQPSISAAPSSTPTVSSQPSLSSAPSSTPTDSPMPSVSAAPSMTPVALALTEPDANATDPQDPDVTATDPDATKTDPVERVDIKNKFALRYLLEGDPEPSDDDYYALSKVTGWYIGNHSLNYYDDMEPIFLETEITSYYQPGQFKYVIDYDAMSYFARHAAIPSMEDHDKVIANAFTAHADRYLDFLKMYLPPENPFSNTQSVDYSTYWEALVAQTTEAGAEAPIESEKSSSAAKIVAPILAIAGTILVAVGVLFVVRERKRRNQASRVNDNRWDENGANLNIAKEESIEEGDTVEMDMDSPPPGPGEHSYIPYLSDSGSLLADCDGSLSTVHEVPSEDGMIMGDMIEKSPSEVMSEMNLSSALEDVDLDSETGGIGELPGRHDTGGIGELPGRHDSVRPSYLVPPEVTTVVEGETSGEDDV
jgi:hypothetical protein